MKAKSNKNLYIIGGAAAVAVGAIALMSGGSSKPTKPLGGDTFDTGSGSGTTPVSPKPSYTPTPTPTTVLNNNLVLMKGSRGSEVKVLQKALGITADGIFGTQTETALFKKKGVVKCSLAQSNSLPNVNPNIYPIGSKLMASLKSGAKVYGDKVLVNGATESSGELYKTVPYGEYVGIIKSRSSLGNWYRVAFGETNWLGNTVYTYGWVLASEVKKY